MDWETAGDPTPLNNTPSPDATSPARSAPGPVPRQQIVEFWKAKGAPPQVAEGIADAVRRESGIRGTAAYDPTAVNPQSGATGLYQDLGSRKAALVATADWEDPATQNNFAYKEVTGGDPEATKHWDEIKAAPSREAASELWTKYFERSRPASSTATVSAGNWNVSPAALDAETRQGHDVRYMSPGEYLAMTPPIEEGSSQSAKFRRLMASLNSGDDVESVPTLDVKRRGDQFAIYDQDGRNRALAAQQAGVDLIPVSIRGLPKSDTPPQAVRDMRGEMHPFDFERVLSAFNPIGTAHAEQAQKSPAVAASAWEPSGAAQPLSGGEWASAGSAEPEWAYRRGEEARKIEPDWFGTGVRTDIGAATQFASRLLPQGLVDTINSINNRLASLGAPLATVPPGGIDEMERQRLAGLEAQRGPSPTFGEMAGEAAPLLAAGALIPGGASLLARVGVGAGLGAAGGVLSPTTSSGSYWPEKSGQIVSGAMLGAVAAPVVDAVVPLVRWAARLVGLNRPTAAAEAVISRIARSPAAPTAQDMMDTAAASAKPLTLADASKRLASLAGRVSRSPGPAADIVQQNLGARASARGARVYSDVAGEFGGGNLYEAARALSEARSAAARPLFEAALQPGSTAPLADMFRAHATEAMRDYQAAVAAEEAAASARGARSGEPDLIRFLISRGGVKDAGGELRAMDLHRVNPGWFGRLSRQNGMSLDRAREAAEEAGYLRHGSDINDLLDAIRETSHGRPTFRPEDAPQGFLRQGSADEESFSPGAMGFDEPAGRSPGDLRVAREDAEGRLRQIERALADADAARAAGIRGAVWSPGLQKILDLPVMQAGIRKGIDIERMRGALPGAGPFRPRDLAITGYDREGEPIVSRVLNMRVLHAAKTGLDTILEGYRNPITGQLQLDNWGYAAQQVRRALVGELRSLNPAYAKAEDAWAGPSAQIEAAQWGAKVLNMDKNAIRDRMAKFSPDQQEFARLGVGSTLHDYLEKTNASPARIGSLLSDLHGGRLEPMFRTPEDFDRFVKALSQERTMAQTDARVLGNSLTAERLAEDRGPALQHGVMLGADILRGHPLGAIYNATRLLSNRMRGSSPEVDADIARLLTTPLSAGSPGMELLRNAATMLPNVRRLYLGRFAAGGAGLAGGGMQ